MDDYDDDIFLSDTLQHEYNVSMPGVNTSSFTRLYSECTISLVYMTVIFCIIFMCLRGLFYSILLISRKLLLLAHSVSLAVIFKHFSN